MNLVTLASEATTYERPGASRRYYLQLSIRIPRPLWMRVGSVAARFIKEAA